jgi:benzoate/toluate 1,2-dioxygenase reductase component
MIIDPYTWHKVSIVSLSRLSESLLLVTVTKPENYLFTAGQYVIARITVDGHTLLRQYSFVSTPGDSSIELLIKLEPQGVVSHWFFETAQVGDALGLTQSFGSFITVNKASHLMIAGGVGIAPFISMLRNDKNLDQKVLYAERNESSLCFVELLDERHASYFISSSSQAIDEKSLKPYIKTDQVIYVCGSKRFVDGISTHLVGLKVPANTIRRELFTLQ